MRQPRIPIDERARLAALDSLNLVYSPAEERFDRVTRLAQRLFQVPIALVSLVASDKQWFKSIRGLTVAETPREVSFCGHAILQEEPFIVTDAKSHEDFADNPLVTGPPHVRFYAGQSIWFKERAVGTLCIIDHVARDFTEEDVDSLQSLAAIVETEFRTASLSETQLQLLEDSQEGTRRDLIDPVTEVWNQRGMEELLPRELAHGVRRQDDFAYMHIELEPDPTTVTGIDEEDVVAVLKEAAQRIRVSLRPYDLIIRTGAPQFAVFAPSCTPDVSELLADRVRARISARGYPVDERFDASVGIVAARADDRTEVAKLKELADVALTDAKATDQAFVRYFM